MQMFFLMKSDLRGHCKSHKVNFMFLITIFLRYPLFKLCVITNIIKTQMWSFTSKVIECFFVKFCKKVVLSIKLSDLWLTISWITFALVYFIGCYWHTVQPFSTNNYNYVINIQLAKILLLPSKCKIIFVTL